MNTSPEDVMSRIFASMGFSSVNWGAKALFLIESRVFFRRKVILKFYAACCASTLVSFLAVAFSSSLIVSSTTEVALTASTTSGVLISTVNLNYSIWPPSLLSLTITVTSFAPSVSVLVVFYASIVTVHSALPTTWVVSHVPVSKTYDDRSSDIDMVTSRPAGSTSSNSYPSEVRGS